MKIIEVENNKYEIIKDYKNGFDEEEFINHYTDFFEDYDYIVGDIAYGKLRLKGFYSDGNKKAKNINNFKFASNYLENDCAVDCKYYILKKFYNLRIHFFSHFSSHHFYNVASFSICSFLFIR